MKKWNLTFILLLNMLFVFAQRREIDSLSSLLRTEKTDLGRIKILNVLSYLYQDSKPDSALLLAQRAWFLSRKNSDIAGESNAMSQMAIAYKSLGNFTKSLEYSIVKLKMDEARKLPVNLTVSYLYIASLYAASKDFDKALLYAKKADSIISDHSQVKRPDSITQKLKSYEPYCFVSIGDIFEKKDMLDSAILYTQKCLDISTQKHDTLLIGTALNNLGNIYRKLGNDSLALKNYRAGIPFILANSDYSTYTESTLGMAQVFDHMGKRDSAFQYGKRSFSVAGANQFIVKSLSAINFLSGLYKKDNSIDSAYAYLEMAGSLKDSIESAEKVRELQNMTTAEQVRQAELEQQRQEQIIDRKEKLQLLFIGIMIPIFFLISILISRRKVHKRLIEFMGVVSVLLFFEYITLLLHPFIAEKSHHSPIIEIVVFVAIAAIITPAHHRIQHWLLKKLGEYNYLKHHKAIEEGEENEEDITEEGTNEAMPGPVI
ncbi:tetratricopeptide repeat protein [Pinibacter soli]|uniref:Tetratricopeptide repeat protein n=1 Tax=Pinibacter soli TaxID=3044211 RepID=A0ABT6RCQ1_9BACT|nr:tetratricopeptide repeat protein [Pinibacter soli]MDI3320330.1 tetratricopeptide repeat protein [Pinibacter soli]